MVPSIEWTPDNLRFFWITFGIASFLLIIGAITTLRWLVRLELRIRARAGMRRWRTMPKPPAATSTARAYVPPSAPKPSTSGGAPMRLNDGPRDWKQRLTD